MAIIRRGSCQNPDHDAVQGQQAHRHEREFEQTGRSRPRLYCSDPCSQWVSQHYWVTVERDRNGKIVRTYERKVREYVNPFGQALFLKRQPGPMAAYEDGLANGAELLRQAQQVGAILSDPAAMKAAMLREDAETGRVRTKSDVALSAAAIPRAAYTDDTFVPPPLYLGQPVGDGGATVADVVDRREAPDTSNTGGISPVIIQQVTRAREKAERGAIEQAVLNLRAEYIAAHEPPRDESAIEGWPVLRDHLFDMYESMFGMEAVRRIEWYLAESIKGLDATFRTHGTFFPNSGPDEEGPIKPKAGRTRLNPGTEWKPWPAEEPV